MNNLLKLHICQIDNKAISFLPLNGLREINFAVQNQKTKISVVRERKININRALTRASVHRLVSLRIRSGSSSLMIIAGGLDGVDVLAGDVDGRGPLPKVLYALK